MVENTYNQDQYIIHFKGNNLKIYIVSLVSTILMLTTFIIDQNRKPKFLLYVFIVLFFVGFYYILRYFLYNFKADNGRVIHKNQWGKKTFFDLKDITSYKCKKNNFQSKITLYINDKAIAVIFPICVNREFLIYDIERYKIPRIS